MAKPKPWRLVFKKNGKLYKVCNFWGWNKDATLNMQVYSTEEKRLHVLKKVSEVRTTNPDGSQIVSQTIAYEDLVPTEFIGNKHTFHPSGYLHTTNSKGDKYKLGIKSIPFEEIENYHQLAIVLPKEPTTYPEILEAELGPSDIVLDTSLFKESPIQIDVYIVRGGKEMVIGPPAEANMDSFDIVCGDNEPYMLFVRCKQNDGMIGSPFPPQTFIASLIKKNE